MPTQKPRPIHRKGCRNVGWIWSENKTHKLIVKLDPNKPCSFISKVIYIPTEGGRHEKQV